MLKTTPPKKTPYLQPLRRFFFPPPILWLMLAGLLSIIQEKLISTKLTEQKM